MRAMLIALAGIKDAVAMITTTTAPTTPTPTAISSFSLLMKLCNSSYL